MPGTKFPDALLIIPEFPPSKPIIQVNKREFKIKPNINLWLKRPIKPF